MPFAVEVDGGIGALMVEGVVVAGVVDGGVEVMVPEGVVVAVVLDGVAVAVDALVGAGPLGEQHLDDLVDRTVAVAEKIENES